MSSLESVIEFPRAHAEHDAYVVRHEHSAQEESVCRMSDQQLVARFGHGMMWYFFFVKFVGVCNLFLFLLSLITMIPQWHYVQTNYGAFHSNLSPYDWSWFNVLFVSTYASGALRFQICWAVTLGAMTLLLIFSIPFYTLWVVRYRRGRYRYQNDRQATDGAESAENASFYEDPFDGQYSIESDATCVNRIHSSWVDMSKESKRQQQSIEEDELDPADNTQDARRLRCSWCCLNLPAQFGICCYCFNRPCPCQMKLSDEQIRAHGWLRCAGRCTSGVVFISLLVAYAAFQYYLHIWTRGLALTNTLLWRTILSLVFVLVDLVWMLCGQCLTNLELHRFWSSYRKSDSLKSFFFRICTFMIFMYAQDLTYDPSMNGCTDPSSLDPSTISFSSCISCQADNRAQQMLILIAINLTVTSSLQVVQVAFCNRISRTACCVDRRRSPDSAFHPPFDLPTEYTELIFRQFMINMTMSLVPLAPLLGCIGALITYWLDRVKLVHFTRHPERSRNAFLKLITLFLGINALAMFLAYPSGLFWLYHMHVLCI